MSDINSRADVPPLTPPGRIGLVGAGAFGRFSIEAYGRSGDLEVVAVADPDPEALSRVVAPGARLLTDWHELVDVEAVEVVHLLTPPYLRGEIGLAALRSGKSVFCEKPLSLSLVEADTLIEAAARSGVALGVDYVMRHQPAYRILESLAASGLFGRLRTFSFQNFAQSVPSDHWFWDREKSGGIFVEHGVHFFDAYGRIAGSPSEVWGRAPRREAVEAMVRYQADVIGRFYHEFAFPIEVEQTLGTSHFERGYIDIEGWIPTRLSGAVLADNRAFRELGTAVAPLSSVGDGAVTRFHIDFPDREASYQVGIVSGMRDVVARHRDPQHAMLVSIQDARASLALALACREAAALPVISC